MKVTVYPSHASGTVAVPPSKSASHRLLICGGLAEGESVIKGISYSEDVLATLDCLSALGATYSVNGDEITVKGTDVTKISGKRFLPCRECGSTLRFMIPLCLIGNAVCELSGSETLMNRPLSVYEELAREQNLIFKKEGNVLTVGGKLTPKTYSVEGKISSQFISGLLFALPLLKSDSVLTVKPPFESRPYVDMTLSAMESFGVFVKRKGDFSFEINGNSHYKNSVVTVESDYSNAAFLDALNVIGGNVKLTGLNENSLQGDRIYGEYFDRLKRGFSQLDISDCPDLGPILFVVASTLHGAKFTGTKRLRIKESDRATAMADELKKCGVKVEVSDNEVTVIPENLHSPFVPFLGHNDHRIVMALTVLATKLGGSIIGAEAVKKSFPDFFVKLRSLGIKTEETD